MSAASGAASASGQQSNDDEAENPTQDRDRQDRVPMLGGNIDGLEDEPGDEHDQDHPGETAVDEQTNREGRSARLRAATHPRICSRARAP